MKKWLFLAGNLTLLFVLTASSPKKIQTLKINQALWGRDVANSPKGITVGYDAKTDVIYTSGIMSKYLVLTHASEDYPFASIDLEDDPHHTSIILIHEDKNRLYWINTMNEAIRVVDLKTQKLIQKHDPLRKTKKGYPVRDAALIPKTGWLWIANTDKKTITGFSPDLKQAKTIAEAKHPFSIAAHPTKNILYFLNARTRSQMELYEYRPDKGRAKRLKTFSATASGRPPRHLALTTDGRFVLAGQGVQVLDKSFKELWSTRVPAGISRLAIVGDRIVCLDQQAGFKTGQIVSLVSVFREATGEKLATLPVRYHATHLAADPKNKRVFVGNDGDGSLSVIDLEALKVTKTIDVANAAEGLVVDHRTGNRYILNRLGGSEIYVWPQGNGTLTRLNGGHWPSELAIDEARRWLIALSHFESAIYLWDLDTQERLETFSLPVSKNTGDTLGDLDYDAQHGVAGVVFPEHGALVVADVPNRKIIWKTTIENLRLGPGAGPGTAQVAIDGEKKQVYLYTQKPPAVKIYNYESGQLVAKISIVGRQPWHFKDKKFPGRKRPPFRKGRPPIFSLAHRRLAQLFPPRQTKRPLPFDQKKPRNQGKRLERAGKKNPYAINTLYLDKTNNRLFAHNTVIETTTNKIKKTIIGVDKVFYADRKIVLGLGVDPRTNQEHLVMLDPKALTVKKRWPLNSSKAVKAVPTYDAVAKRLYLSDLVEAQVVVYDLGELR